MESIIKHTFVDPKTHAPYWRIVENYPLGKRSWMKAGGGAEIVLIPKTVDDLAAGVATAAFDELVRSIAAGIDSGGIVNVAVAVGMSSSVAQLGPTSAAPPPSSSAAQPLCPAVPPPTSAAPSPFPFAQPLCSAVPPPTSAAPPSPSSAAPPSPFPVAQPPRATQLVTVLGGLSNVIIRDGGISGIVILLPRNGKCHRVDETSRKEALFVFDAGVSCYDAFAFAQAAGFSGMEFLIGIPGTIGGAVFMNAGAHGTEVKDVIEWAEVIGFFSNPLDSSDLVNGKSSNGRGIYRINKDQLAQQMQYRNGGFEPEHIIIRACFRLTAADRDVIWKRGMQLLDERARKLSPIGICCGFAGNNWNDGGGSGDGARDASGSGDGGSARGSGDGGSARGSGGGSDGASSSSNGRDSARSSSSSVDGSRNGGDSSGSDGNYNGGGRGSRNDGGRSHNHSSTRSPGPNAGIGTAGSTFKNPPEKPAWALIDEAGCRGQRLGGAAISEHHANFLINTGNATASELEDLGELVREKVFEKSGVMLQWEIRRLGERFGKSNKSRRRQ